MFRLLMLPSNVVCDALKIDDEQERGVVRMLVNTLLWTAVPTIVMTVAWIVLSRGA